MFYRSGWLRCVGFISMWCSGLYYSGYDVWSWIVFTWLVRYRFWFMFRAGVTLGVILYYYILYIILYSFIFSSSLPLFPLPFPSLPIFISPYLFSSSNIPLPNLSSVLLLNPLIHQPHSKYTCRVFHLLIYVRSHLQII